MGAKRFDSVIVPLTFILVVYEPIGGVGSKAETFVKFCPVYV